MRTIKQADSHLESPRNYPNLTRQYGEIGISAVAAAVRYQNEEATYAPVRARGYSDHED